MVQLGSILNYYVVDNDNGLSIEDQIQKDFPNQIFNTNSKNKKELLYRIIEQEFDQFRDLFANKVVLEIKADDHYVKESETYHSIWSEFKDEIKFNNRFHITKTIDLIKLKGYFVRSLNATIPKDTIFFRGRISEKTGFELNEMGNPPIDKAKAGRANPFGISYLYLADQVETALYETRSSVFDYVTIGTFKALEDVKIVNLHEIIYEPINWAETEELEDYLIYIPFLNILQKELSLPIRGNDKEIDYLPTQYLCEFIKSLGYDGVKFQSSFFSSGFNLAIFSTKKFDCQSSKIYDIESIKYLYKEVK